MDEGDLFKGSFVGRMATTDMIASPTWAREPNVSSMEAYRKEYEVILEWELAGSLLGLQELG